MCKASLHCLCTSLHIQYDPHAYFSASFIYFQKNITNIITTFILFMGFIVTNANVMTLVSSKTSIRRSVSTSMNVQRRMAAVKSISASILTEAIPVCVILDTSLIPSKQINQRRALPRDQLFKGWLTLFTIYRTNHDR